MAGAECDGRPRREPSAAVSEECGECIPAMIRGDDVQFPILIEVHELKAARVEFGRRAHREWRSRGAGESPFAVTEENIHGIPVAAGHSEVGDFVAVQVLQPDVSRLVAQVDWAAGRRGKMPGSVPELHHHDATLQMLGHHVEATVTIDIREGHLPGTLSDDNRRAGRGAKQRALRMNLNRPQQYNHRNQDMHSGHRLSPLFSFYSETLSDFRPPSVGNIRMTALERAPRW